MIITQNFPFLCAKLNDVMKLLSYLKDSHEQLAILIDGFVYDMDVLHPDLPNSMNMFLTYWEDSYPIAQAGALLIHDIKQECKPTHTWHAQARCVTKERAQAPTR